MSLTPLYETLKTQTIEKELAFPVEEYDRRIAAVRAAMARDGLDALVLVHKANIGYVTGYDSHMAPTYALGILTPTAGPILHTAELESPVAILHSIIDDVRIFDWTNASSTADDLAGVLSDLGVAQGRIGIELRNDENFTQGAYDTASYLTLNRALPEAELVDATHIVLEQRLVKSDAELAHMREAAKLTMTAFDAAYEATEAGTSENLIAAAAYSAATAAGSELMSIDPMLLTGWRTGLMPHLPYRRHVLEQGDMVYLEMTGTYWRYNGPAMRSWVIGTPSARQQQIADAALAVLETVIAEARPGRTGHDVAQVAAKHWQGIEGLHFHGGYGYAIGMANQPSWCEQAVYIADGDDHELEPGMTFHLPINPVWPGELGVGFSESIVITADGAEILGDGRNRSLRSV